MLKDLALVVLGALLGALASHWLNKYPARNDKDRAIILGLVNSLRALIPPISSRVDQGYLFANELTSIRKLLADSETQASYLNLPKKTKRLVSAMINDVDIFSKTFVQAKDAIYPFFGNLKEPHGGGSAREIVATNLVCMTESEVPRIPLKVNFPRDFSGHFSQANLTPDQVQALWEFGNQKAPVAKFKASQGKARNAVADLDADLANLQET